MLADSPFINLKNLLSAEHIQAARLQFANADTHLEKLAASQALLKRIIPVNVPAK